MICYKDRTWCMQQKCKHWDACDRALTEKVMGEAEKWWGSDKAPISIYAEAPECFEYGKPKRTT